MLLTVNLKYFPKQEPIGHLNPLTISLYFGSSTLFEILGTKTLSIIIPSVNVTANHQYYNAVYFKKLGLIEMIEEKDLTLTNFINTFNTLITEKELYQERMNNYQNNYQIDKMINEVLNE